MNNKFLPVAVLTVIVLLSCGGGDNAGDEIASVIEKTGAIESGDTRDPNHSDLAYDAYDFEAETLDLVRIEVITEGFSPLLKLVEVSTWAVIAEWDPAYGIDDALTYTIAGAGSYEARVYAMEDGTGDYILTITVTPYAFSWIIPSNNISGAELESVHDLNIFVDWTLSSLLCRINTVEFS